MENKNIDSLEEKTVETVTEYSKEKIKEDCENKLKTAKKCTKYVNNFIDTFTSFIKELLLSIFWWFKDYNTIKWKILYFMFIFFFFLYPIFNITLVNNFVWELTNWNFFIKKEVFAFINWQTKDKEIYKEYLKNSKNIELLKNLSVYRIKKYNNLFEDSPEIFLKDKNVKTFLSDNSKIMWNKHSSISIINKENWLYDAIVYWMIEYNSTSIKDTKERKYIWIFTLKKDWFINYTIINYTYLTKCWDKYNSNLFDICNN